MVRFRINGKSVNAKKSSTVLAAAESLGIPIPTMCHLNAYPPFTSCMVCVVKDKASGRLIPSCSTLVEPGMDIETDDDEVRQARKTTLELLLSDHVGDCEGPCRQACPAHMNIPLMLKQIEACRFREALITVKEHIALPAVLGRICPAPCEKACRRAQIDSPLAICLLKRFVADADLASESPFIPECKEASGKSVGIVGAGPAGLSAAYTLLQLGHACTIFDNNPEPGGQLRYGVPEVRLPRRILDAEIGPIEYLGAELRQRQTVGRDISLDEIRRDFDAVVWTTGSEAPLPPGAFGLETTDSGVKIHPRTFQTSRNGIFSGGAAVRPSRLAVRSVAHGRSIAHSVSRFLESGFAPVVNARFNSSIGKLKESEKEACLRYVESLSSRHQRTPCPDEALNRKDISTSQAASESARCLHCECLKSEECKLRHLAETYEARPHRFRGTDRKPLEKITEHPHVVYEPGKCIKCGICVRITESIQERLGLTFIGRGFDVRVDVSLGRKLDEGLKTAASECVSACPTGALAFFQDGRME